MGVSNFTIPHLQHLLARCTVRPSINQFEAHPYFPNTELIRFCQDNGVLPVAYSPLGSQLQNLSLPRDTPTVLMDQTLRALAEKRRDERDGEATIDVATMCISWAVQRNCGVVPMSGSKERIRSNAKLVRLSDGEMDVIDGLVGSVGEGNGKGIRFVDLESTFGWDVFGDRKGSAENVN